MSTQLHWYCRLRGGEGKGEGLLDYQTPPEKGLVVCQQVGNPATPGESNRYFTAFDNYLQFGHFHLNEVAPSHQCFFEVIFEGSQKPYFDLDIPLATPEHPGATPDESKELYHQLLKAILRVIPVKPRDILSFTSHSSQKHSYHIIVDKWAFPNYEENKAFSLKVAEEISPSLRHYIDSSMYKSLQQLRIVGSHKWGSERVKTYTKCDLPDWEEWSPPEVPRNPTHAFIMLLGASLVSNTRSCQFLPSFAAYIPQKIRIHDSADLEAKDVDLAFQLASQIDSGHELGESKGSLILLKRVKASMCPVCQRVHEAENPFLTVIGFNRDIYFNCRRGPPGAKIKVGSLGPEVGEIPSPLPPPPKAPKLSSLPKPQEKHLAEVAAQLMAKKMAGRPRLEAKFDLAEISKILS